MNEYEHLPLPPTNETQIEYTFPWARDFALLEDYGAAMKNEFTCKHGIRRNYKEARRILHVTFPIAFRLLAHRNNLCLYDYIKVDEDNVIRLDHSKMQKELH